jgi:hypothetical protein
MINTQVYINNIVTDLTSKTWISPTTSGVTSFTNIYDFPNWGNDGGYPFLCILDNPQSSSFDTTGDLEMQNNIEFHICANWTVVTGAKKSDKRNECMLRIREAYDFLRGYIISDTNIERWLTTPNTAVRGDASNLTWRKMNLSVRTENIDELNLYRRIITLPITDIVENN